MYCISSSVSNLALAIQQAVPLAPETQTCAKALPLTVVANADTSVMHLPDCYLTHHHTKLPTQNSSLCWQSQ